MWRRLCLDLDEDGTLIGASVEFYDDSTVSKNAVLVMEPGWAESRTYEQACADLLTTGTFQPSLFSTRVGGTTWAAFGYPSSSVIEFHRPPA